jgi:hypothetical protein
MNAIILEMGKMADRPIEGAVVAGRLAFPEPALIRSCRGAFSREGNADQVKNPSFRRKPESSFARQIIKRMMAEGAWRHLSPVIALICFWGLRRIFSDSWIPACAGMTDKCGVHLRCHPTTPWVG